MDSNSNNNDRYHTKPTPSSESKVKGFSSAADDRSSTPTQQMDQLHLHPHSHHHHHQQLDDLAPPPAMLNPLEEYDPSRSLGPLSMLEPLNDSWIDSNQHQHEYQPVFDPSSTVLRSLEVDSVLGHSSFSSAMDPRMHSGDVHDTFDDNSALDSHLQQQQQPLSAEAFEPVVNEHWLPPAPKGDYVERFSHVLCADGVSPRLVYLSSFDALVEQRVDCVPQGHKFKISCESYCEDAKIVFRVRVYTLADGKYCLEFQRRAGDAFHFHSLYYNCLRKLSQENMIVLQQSLPPCFAPEPAVRFDPARAPETIELLRGMIASPYLDVSCEGLRSLCQFARQSQMHEPLFSAGALNIFLESMQSPNEETRRLATAGCASLIFHHGDACRRVVESGSVDTLVACIVMRGANGGQADYSLQLVREMSRVLLHLAEELGPELLVTIKKADAATCIHNLEQSRDFVLRNDASRLRDLVGAH